LSALFNKHDDDDDDDTNYIHTKTHNWAIKNTYTPKTDNNNHKLGWNY